MMLLIAKHQLKTEIVANSLLLFGKKIKLRN